MSGSKYFVYGERWRELDTETGSVAGWGRKVHFLYVRRGRLRVAKRRRVLAALQLHAASRPSAISLGNRLSMLSNERRDGNNHKKTSAPALPAPQPIHRSTAVCESVPKCGCVPYGNAALPQCCTHYTQCNNNCMRQAPWDTHNNSLQIQTDKPNDKSDQIVNSKRNSQTGSQFVSLLQDHTITNKPSLDRDSKGRFLKSKEKRVNAVKPNQNVNSKNEKENDRKSDSSDDGSDSEDLCKELTIPDSDVRALRSYVARTRSDALVRFDADNEYKLALFYAINPLVYVARCAKTERAIRERLPMALAPFAARLGLTPSPRPGLEGTQPNRRLRTKIRQENLIPSSNKYVEKSSDSDSDDFQKTSKSKSYNNHTASKEVNNKNRENKVMNNVKSDNIKNKNVNLQKKSNQDSDTDYKSTNNKNNTLLRSKTSIHQRCNQSDSDSSGNDSSRSSDSDSSNDNNRNSFRKRTLLQSKRKKRESSTGDTSESDRKSDKNKSMNRNRDINKNNKQDTDSDSNSDTEKENKRSSLRNSNIKQKRLRHDSSSSKSHTDDNNSRKKAKTEKHHNNEQAAQRSPHTRRKLLRKVRQYRHISHKQRNNNTHIIHDSCSEEDQETSKKEHNPSNKHTTLNNNRHKTKESTTNSDSDFKTNKSATEKVKHSSLRKISISSKSDDSSRKKLDSTSSELSDSDSLKENKKIRSILRKRTNEDSSTGSSSENTSSESEPKSKTKNLKVKDSDSNNESIAGKENKRNNSLKRNRRDENRRNALSKTAKIQKKNIKESNNHKIKRITLDISKTQTKTNRLNPDKEIAQQQTLISDYVRNSNSRDSRRERNLNADRESSDSDDIFDKSRSKRDILRKRNRAEETGKDNADKVKASSDRKDNSSKVSSSDRKDHSRKERAASDRKDNSGKTRAISDRKDHSGKEKGSSNKKDNSSREKVTSNIKHNSSKVKSTSDSKDNSSKRKVSSDKKDQTGKMIAQGDRRDMSGKMEASSDSRDTSSKRKVSSDGKDNSKRERASSDRRNNLGKDKTSSDRKESSIKMLARSDRRDNSSKRESTSDKKDNSGKEKITNDRKHKSDKTTTSDRSDKVSSESVMGPFRKVLRRASNNAGTMVKKKTIYISNKRPNEYSNLEDHAIVAWVLNGGRARRVNGNQLWKELVQQYHKLTGVSRSWHSVRNRYLRYILPSLGALGLPPGDVSRLRAAAATGEIKTKRESGRRNSMFKEKVVRTAFRPRPPPVTPLNKHHTSTDSRTSSTDKQTDDSERHTESKQVAVVRSTRSRSRTKEHIITADTNNKRRDARPSRRSIRSAANTPTFSLAPGTSTPSSPPKMRKLFNPNIVHDELNDELQSHVRLVPTFHNDGPKVMVFNQKHIPKS